VGRKLRQFAQGFAQKRRVALHNEAGNALVPRPGRVGYRDPTLLFRDARGFADGIIVVSIDPDDLRAEPHNRGDALVAHAGMNEDRATGPDELRALRDRPPMVSIRRARDDHPLRYGLDLGRLQFANVDGSTSPAEVSLSWNVIAIPVSSALSLAHRSATLPLKWPSNERKFNERYRRSGQIG
jgi:hypothetical protein